MQNVIENTGVRKTYPQDWRAYNAAQTSEKDHFLRLLHELCGNMKEQPRQTNGRPRLPLNDAIFSICYKIYSTVSGRRFISDLREANEKGYISRTPHFNSLFNYLENPSLTPILKALITLTSLPFTALETDFAVDSSGFTTTHYARWYDHKYGEKPRQEWVKVHIMCGAKTQIVTAVEIKEQYTFDGNQLPDLVDATAQNFRLNEVSGDKAYASLYNYNVIERHGATPFIAFKINNTAGNGGLWTKMFHYFHLNQEEFLKHYHKRSKVESTFAMIKAKFGGYVRSKTEVSRVNECLCKIICHNICVFIQEMHEMGLDVEYAKFLPAQKGAII